MTCLKNREEANKAEQNDRQREQLEEGQRGDGARPLWSWKDQRPWLSVEWGATGACHPIPKRCLTEVLSSAVLGVPVVVQRVKNLTSIHEDMWMWVWSVALLSGLRSPCCHKLQCRSQMQLDPVLLWLWCRPQLQFLCDPLPRNFHMLPVQPLN